jgi:hypothetical protein
MHMLCVEPTVSGVSGDDEGGSAGGQHVLAPGESWSGAQCYPTAATAMLPICATACSVLLATDHQPP